MSSHIGKANLERVNQVSEEEKATSRGNFFSAPNRMYHVTECCLSLMFAPMMERERRKKGRESSQKFGAGKIGPFPPLLLVKR